MQPLRTVEPDWYATRRAPRVVKPRHPEPPTRPAPRSRSEPPVQLAEKQRALLARIDRATAMLPSAYRRSTVAIINLVAAHFGLEPPDLRVRSNRPAICLPRQIAMYIARRLTRASLPEIGRLLGGWHHATVMNAIGSVERRRESDEELRALVDTLMAEARATVAERRPKE